MGILIDTGVFIRWERENGKTDFGRWDSYGSAAISVITQSELMVGVLRANTPQRRERRLGFVQAVLANVRAVQKRRHMFDAAKDDTIRASRSVVDATLHSRQRGKQCLSSFAVTPNYGCRSSKPNV